MTYFYYKTNTWSSQPQTSKETIDLWNHLSEKSNWRITQLPNGYYQTEYKDPNCTCDPKLDPCCEKWNDVTRRETLTGAEQAVDGAVDHYKKRAEFVKGPKVVKTFE